MRETLFSLTPFNRRQCQSLFRGARQNEYYEGDYWLDDAPFIRVTCERVVTGSISIASIHALNRQYFRRDRRHIRKDNLDICVAWFILKGEVTFSNHLGTQRLGAGEFLLTRSIHPFYIACEPGKDDCCDIVNIVLPTLQAREFIAFDGHPTIMLNEACRESAIARDLILSALNDSDHLADASIRHLADTALSLIGHAVASDGSYAPLVRSPSLRRYNEIIEHIDAHLFDPELSPRTVARACGISLRHLSNIMSSHQAQFSDTMWEKRLDKALALLIDADRQDVTIGDIAYSVGFKSPAHFSRMFKQAFGRNARDVRAEACRRYPPALSS